MEHHEPNHYKASRGGHAPDHVRESFDEWADSGMESEIVQYDGQQNYRLVGAVRRRGSVRIYALISSPGLDSFASSKKRCSREYRQ